MSRLVRPAVRDIDPNLPAVEISDEVYARVHAANPTADQYDIYDLADDLVAAVLNHPTAPTNQKGS
jgi:hypothetical protein